MKRIWVVEMLNCVYANIPPRWEPTVGCGFNREDARIEARRWRKKKPFDTFRVRPYVNRK